MGKYRKETIDRKKPHKKAWQAGSLLPPPSSPHFAGPIAETKAQNQVTLDLFGTSCSCAFRFARTRGAAIAQKQKRVTRERGGAQTPSRHRPRPVADDVLSLGRPSPLAHRARRAPTALGKLPRRVVLIRFNRLPEEPGGVEIGNP
uniref:Uncharacterized protein n=1 Tax=Oryza rufipogon TaxID=4529 RepID=A0A0E0MTY8_ORYRU